MIDLVKAEQNIRATYQREFDEIKDAVAILGFRLIDQEAPGFLYMASMMVEFEKASTRAADGVVANLKELDQYADAQPSPTGSWEKLKQNMEEGPHTVNELALTLQSSDTGYMKYKDDIEKRICKTEIAVLEKQGQGVIANILKRRLV